jgi:hypothetical protein
LGQDLCDLHILYTKIAGSSGRMNPLLFIFQSGPILKIGPISV